jgi:hypothetical protein
LSTGGSGLNRSKADELDVVAILTASKPFNLKI